MQKATYKWIIGCLIGIIVILITFLILKENGNITVSFSDAISLAATISSLILSVVAMMYTYYAGRDTEKIQAQIQSTITEMDGQMKKVLEDTSRNSERLSQVIDGMNLLTSSINSSVAAISVIEQEQSTKEEKQVAKDTMERSKNSMLMFLQKMQDHDKGNE